MRRKTLGALAFVALLLMAGCISISVDSTVGADGTIDTYNADISMNNSVYGLYRMRASQQGYDKVGNYLLANASIDKANAGSVTIEKTAGKQRTNITIKMKNYDPGPNSNITVKKQDGTMIYRDAAFGGSGNASNTQSNSQMMQATNMSFDYRLDMPGKITNASEGAEINGDVAEWHIDGNFQGVRIYAESKITEKSGGGSGFGPGFGVVGVLAAMALAATALWLRADD